MDYRVWIKNEDWNQSDEAALREIDQAVEWGKEHSIHVCINFHRAPGYTVASPPEPTSVWTDEETQRVCAAHWTVFAKRYRGIPSRNLSFNLFNEPVDVPTWPSVMGQGLFLSKTKTGLKDGQQNPMVITGRFDRPTPATIRLGKPSVTHAHRPRRQA